MNVVRLIICPVGASHCVNCDAKTKMQVDDGTGKCSYFHICSDSCIEGVREMVENWLAIGGWPGVPSPFSGPAERPC